MQTLPMRSWFYFRTGYGTYIAMTLGIINVLTTTYYLIPAVEDFFPDFVTYVILAVVIGLPVTVGIGFFHFKKSKAFSSEVDINVESNPYNFKLMPGHLPQAIVPTQLEILRLCMKMSKQEKLNEEDEKRFKELERKLLYLMNGGDIRKIQFSS